MWELNAGPTVNVMLVYHPLPLYSMPNRCKTFFSTQIITVITEPVCIYNCRIACGEFIFVVVVVAIVLLKWQPFENDWYCLYDNHVFACQPDNTHHTPLDTQLSQKRVSLNGN